jgi:hypothetical protein
MMSSSWTTHEVFDFTPDEKDFRLNKRFRQTLIRSHSPFLIILIGNGRTGKSTRANQLLCHELSLEKPFTAAGGLDPITKYFQYVGPLKFSKLSQIHKIQLEVKGDPDIFIIDCEGLNSFGETTPALKQATFALSQMSSMTLLVLKDQVNQQNINSIRSLFVLSHAFSRDIPGFTIDTTIMMREVDVPFPRRQNFTPEEKNVIRQKADETERDKILKVLNDAQIKFCTDDFLVLSQPTFDQEELYWLSINDFLLFTRKIASQRATISGKTLIQMFDEAKPSIMRITDFENPAIPFEKIIENIVVSDLKAASDAALENLENNAQPYFRSLSSFRLREGLDIQFVLQTSLEIVKRFEQEASGLFPHLLEHSETKTQAVRNEMELKVKSTCDKLFVLQCIDVLLPDLQQEIFTSITADIQKEMNGLDVKDVNNFNFTALTSRHERFAIVKFEHTVKMAHEGLLNTQAFRDSILALRLLVSNHVKDLETRRKAEYNAFMIQEKERQDQESDARFHQDMKEMTDNAEMERSKVSREITELQNEFERAAAAYKVTQEIAIEALKRQNEQELEFQKQFEQTVEKQKEEHEKLKQRLLTEYREAEERSRKLREAESKAAAAHEARLQAQISQLKNRQKVIYKPRPRRCSVY